MQIGERLSALRARANDSLRRLPGLRKFDDHVQLTAARLDCLNSRIDVPPALVDEFERVRQTPEFLAPFDDPNPLVTTCVGTYNRARLLTERCLPSLVRQTYQNLEIIVVGDCCTDDTAARVAQLGDPRIRFINLPQQGRYPEDPLQRWMVAGTVPINYALGEARGDFVTHLDDDDEHAPDRIEKLLHLLRTTRADIAYHPFWFERERGFDLNFAPAFRYRCVTTSSVFYHRWWKRVPWDLEAYRSREPGDWNRFRKFVYMNARAVRHPDPLLRHYRERSQKT